MAYLYLNSTTGISLDGIDWVFSSPNYPFVSSGPDFYSIRSDENFDFTTTSAYFYSGKNFTYTTGVLTGGTVNSFSWDTPSDNYFTGGFSITLADAAAVGNGRPLLELLLNSADQIYGSNGADIVYSGAGDDFVSGYGGDDQLYGEDGNDNLFGDDGDDNLAGGNGNDTLTGGTGADILAGGPGDDLYYVDPLDTITENPNEGTDTVLVTSDATLPANVEVLVLQDAATRGTSNPGGGTIFGNATADSTLTGDIGNDVLAGFAGNDTLSGGAGNDTLIGGAGTDTMQGGPGDDLYYVDPLDTFAELPNQGTDTLVVTNDIILPANFEVLILQDAATNGTGNPAGATIFANPAAASTLTGDTGDDVLVGMGAGDTLSGNAGNDTLIAGADTDAMVGGAGDDTYWVGSPAQSVTEQPNEGADTLVTSTNLIQPANVETLILWRSGTIALGNDADNVIFGNALAVSRLDGGAGNDTILGGSGADIIIGNSGDDALAGGGGADLFQFEQVDFGHDTIFGFSGAGGDGDQIDLRGWGFASFADVPVTATPNGSLITAGANSILLANVPSLTAADVLI
jgi:Ca2+-binding RTX toxin-like protein